MHWPGHKLAIGLFAGVLLATGLAMGAVMLAGRAGDDEAGTLHFGPRPDHGNPAVDAHAPRLRVAIIHAPAAALRPRETHIATTVRTNDA